jgi:hypothetical protein
MLLGVGDILFSGAKVMAGQAGKPRATQGGVMVGQIQTKVRVLMAVQIQTR